MGAHHAASDRHHPVVVIIATGTTGAVRAEIPVLIAGAVLHLPAPVVALLLEDAAAVGMIIVHALVKQLHHKGVITYLRPVAEAGFTGTLVHVLAAQAEQVPHLLEQHLLLEEQVAVLVHPDITGCLIMAVGACPMVQLAAEEPLQPQPRLNRPRHHRQLLPNLLPLQANQLQPLVRNKTIKTLRRNYSFSLCAIVNL